MFVIAASYLCIIGTLLLIHFPLHRCVSNEGCDGIWINADPSSSNVCWNATVSPSSVSRDHPENVSVSSGWAVIHELSR